MMSECVISATRVEIVDDLKAHEDKAEVVLRDDAEQLGYSPLAHLPTSGSRAGPEIPSRGLASREAGIGAFRVSPLTRQPRW